MSAHPEDALCGFDYGRRQWPKPTKIKMVDDRNV
jgi:hypothetical protein